MFVASKWGFVEGKGDFDVGFCTFLYGCGGIGLKAEVVVGIPQDAEELEILCRCCFVDDFENVVFGAEFLDWSRGYHYDLSI